MDAVFAAYSRRFLISRLKHNLPYNISRSGARSLRVLWYMREMGGGWLTFRDLSLIGAGQYKALQYAIPDLVKDLLVDEIQLTRKHGKPQIRYQINSRGLKLLEDADDHVKHEYENAIDRVAAFKERYGIRQPEK